PTARLSPYEMSTFVYSLRGRSPYDRQEVRMDLLGTAANVAQILGLNNLKSVFAVLTLTFLWQAGSAFWTFMNWRMLTLSAGWKFGLWLFLLVGSCAGWIYLIQRPENLVRNAHLVQNTNY